MVKTTLFTHKAHKAIALPKDFWSVKTQREKFLETFSAQAQLQGIKIYL